MDYFSIELIDDPHYGDDLKRYVLKNPYETDLNDPDADNFLVFGIFGIFGRGFKSGQEFGNWGEYENPPDHSPSYHWMKDVVKFFFEKNINTMGAESNIEENDTKWFDRLAEEHYPGCAGSEHKHFLFGSAKIGESVLLSKTVNDSLEIQSNADPGGFPRPYFPYLSYIYITQPLYESKLISWRKDDTKPGWQMVPDVWHPNFQDESYLKSFLVLSDGLQGYSGGRWVYDDTDLPFVETGDEPVLHIPDFWECHAPAALKDQHALIAIILGYDVPHYWGSVNPSVQGHVSLLRPWMRALLAQRYDPNHEHEIPPARTEFVNVMKEQYGENTGFWNTVYPDYEIDNWYLIEAGPNPDYDRILETMDLFYAEQGDENNYRYPDGYFPNEPDGGTFAEWLESPVPANQLDLGYQLKHQPQPEHEGVQQIISDAEAFRKKLAEKHHQVAIDAIRFFDPNHMIFSECSNWTTGRPTETFENYDPSGTIQTIMETYGQHFPDDKISAITTQIYPTVPEANVEKPGTGHNFRSFNSKCTDIARIVRNIHEKSVGELIVPFLIGSYTFHADWEKKWDFNWNRNNCPWEDDEYRVDDDWLINAPLPHRIEGVMPDLPACALPSFYIYTETGLLDNWNEIVSGDYHYGRGNDFNIISSALLQRVPIQVGGPGEEQDHVVFLGMLFHNMYDLNLDHGDDTEDSENWGFVNQTVDIFGDPIKDPEGLQYKQLHEFYHLRAGSIQIVHGPGEPWSLDDAVYPDPDPDLEIDPEFGEYNLE